MQHRSATTVAAKFPTASRSNLQLGDIILKQAAEITRFRAERDRLREALMHIADTALADK